jgi:hypothetical protein
VGGDAVTWLLALLILALGVLAIFAALGLEDTHHDVTTRRTR